MPLAPKYLPNYKYEDYKNWKGDWELIEGIPYAMSPSPSVSHQQTASNLHFAFRLALSKACEACTLLYEIDWIISDTSIVRPDLLIMCEELTEQFVTEPPTLIIEILSPSTAHKDKGLKLKLYQENKVKYYLICDPESQEILMYELGNGLYKKRAFELEDLKAQVFDLKDCEIAVDLSKIWA